MIQPLVSIITINYNQPLVTAAMLQSITQLTYLNYEVIVVDNASPTQSSANLKTTFPFITHITCPVNLGFAGGNNIGLLYAKGDYVFFINNDTVLTPDLLTTMVNYLQLHPNVGIACPKIKYFSSPTIIQYAGAVGLHPLTSRSFDVGYQHKDEGQFDFDGPTDLPNGAAMIVPMQLIKKIGQMSEMFFLYYEELDWAAKFKKAGYAIHYVGTTEIFHKESISTGKNSSFKTFYIFRNRLLYIRRNYTGYKALVASLFFVMISTPVHILKHAVKKEWDHVKAIVKALIWNIKNNAFKEPSVNSASLKNKLIID